jgi:hypothetical protein
LTMPLALWGKNLRWYLLYLGSAAKHSPKAQKSEDVVAGFAPGRGVSAKRHMERGARGRRLTQARGRRSLRSLPTARAATRGGLRPGCHL